MRRAARIDENQPDIVDALRKRGAFVQSLAAIGKGCPDLLVGFHGRWFILEVKNSALPPSKQRLTPDERDWITDAQRRAPVHIVNNTVEAVGILEMVAP